MKESIQAATTPCNNYRKGDTLARRAVSFLYQKGLVLILVVRLNYSTKISEHVLALLPALCVLVKDVGLIGFSSAAQT